MSSSTGSGGASAANFKRCSSNSSACCCCWLWCAFVSHISTNSTAAGRFVASPHVIRGDPTEGTVRRSVVDGHHWRETVAHGQVVLRTDEALARCEGQQGVRQRDVQRRRHGIREVRHVSQSRRRALKWNVFIYCLYKNEVKTH